MRALHRAATLRSLLAQIATLTAAGCAVGADADKAGDTDLGHDTGDTDVADTDPADTDVADTDVTDTDVVWLTPSCVDGVWRPLDQVLPPPSYVHLIVARARPIDWDTGTVWGAEIVQEQGLACWDSLAPLQCALDWTSAVDALSGPFLGTTDGGSPQLWVDAAGLRTVVGDIDTLDEAFLRVWMDMGALTTLPGTLDCTNAEGHAVSDGYRVDVRVMVSDCPIRHSVLQLHVSTGGVLTEVGAVPEADTGNLCIGRRPPGLCLDTQHRATLGATLARHATLEAASVVAFDQLHAELSALGAPADLLGRVRRAARDETRHARQVGALARRYCGTPEAPIVETTSLRDVEAIAVDNAVEGCVGETWGALVGLWQGDHARDPAVAATMRRVARDEVRHAALSWEIDAWLDTRLDAAARARVAAAREAAVDRLRDAAGRRRPDAARDLLGLPSETTATALFAGLQAMLAA